MPTYEPKSINNKSRESISKSGRSYLSLDGNTVHNISKNSGVADRWIPSNQDELDDFIDIISPMGKEVDDYIKMGYGSSANPNNYFTVGDNNVISTFKSKFEDGNSIDTKDDSANRYRSLFYNTDQLGNIGKNSSLMFYNVWNDLKHAIHDNEFYSEDNIENNFGFLAKQYIHELKVYMDEGHEPEEPDISSINRIIDFKRSCLSMIDRVTDKEDSFSKYVLAQKEMYDYKQRYQMIQKSIERKDGIYSEAELDRHIVEMSKKVDKAQEAANNLINENKSELTSKLDTAMRNMGNGEKRKVLIFSLSNSSEFTNMLDSIRDLNDFAKNNIKDASFNRDEYNKKVENVKSNIITYLDHLYAGKTGKFRDMVNHWKNNDFYNNPITPEIINDFEKDRGTTDGQKRVKAALEVLNDLRENDKYTKMCKAKDHKAEFKSILRGEPVNVNELDESRRSIGNTSFDMNMQKENSIEMKV